jgi:PAS domain S-box-containing protein
MEAANDALIIIDERGIIESCNYSALILFGYERSDLTGQNVKMLMPEPLSSMHDGFISHYLQTGEKRILGVRAREVDARKKDGTVVPVELVVSEVRVGARRMFLGALRDISERKRAEREIVELNERLERRISDSEQARERTAAILAAVADGIIVTDDETRVVTLNPAAETLLNAPSGEVIGKSLQMAIADEALRRHIVSTHSTPDGTEAFDLTLADPLGARRVFQAKSSAINGRSGRPQGFVTSIRDVTREREIDRLKTDFISTAAHELRTPLTSIQGFSEILLTRSDLSAAEAKKFLGYINTQAQHLANIIADLLDLAKIEAGDGLKMVLEHFEIGELAGDIIAMLQPMAISHCFEQRFVATPRGFRADKTKLSQILKNVIGNAIKYSPGGGLIRAVGMATADGYTIAISDQGRGMSPDQVQRIFQRFWRADASNTAIEGTGLGMTIVEALVNAHHGRVDVESFVGNGTTISIFLPTEFDDAQDPCG